MLLKLLVKYADMTRRNAYVCYAERSEASGAFIHLLISGSFEGVLWIGWHHKRIVDILSHERHFNNLGLNFILADIYKYLGTRFGISGLHIPHANGLL